MAIEEHLEVFNDRLKVSEQRLSRNWVLQVALIVVSVLSFTGGEDLSSAAKAQVGLTIDAKVVGLIIATMLVYQFMRFGFLVNTFYAMRQCCDKALERHLGGDENCGLFEKLFETGSLFEPLVNKTLEHREVFVGIVIAIMAALVACSHASVLVHLHRAFGPTTGLVVGGVLGIILLPFYAAFVNSPVVREHGKIKLLIALVPIPVSVLLYVLWALNFGAS